jgi:CDP-diacylglycerol pyrophosphatase
MHPALLHRFCFSFGMFSCKYQRNISLLTGAAMGSQTRPYTDKNVSAIDRKRERERRNMLHNLYSRAGELSVRLVQRLLDNHVIETTSGGAIRELFRTLFEKIPNMEEFDVQYKLAPLRQLVVDPNFVSLYITQYIIEDLLDNDKIQDVFGDDLTIYNVVDSVLGAVRTGDEE